MPKQLLLLWCVIIVKLDIWKITGSVPVKGLRFTNCESFLDFHEAFFENVFKIENSFFCY